MKRQIDMDKIARGLRAERRGKVSAKGGYFGGGIGLRAFTGKSWGVRPEFQFRRYQYSQGHDNVILLALGFFKQFGK